MVANGNELAIVSQALPGVMLYNVKTQAEKALHDPFGRGPMRLDATSSIVFAFDETVSGGRSYIIQRSYPGGRDMGIYQNGDLSGITTIPNTLSN
jgi:hypothetical protein